MYLQLKVEPAAKLCGEPQEENSLPAILRGRALALRGDVGRDERAPARPLSELGPRELPSALSPRELGRAALSLGKFRV